MDIAGVAHPEVVRRVTYAGPDVEEVGSFLLAARERIGGEAKRLTRGPAGPYRMRQQRQVPARVPARVLPIVVLLRDLIAVFARQPPESGVLILPYLAGRPSLGPLNEAAMVEVAGPEQALADSGHDLSPDRPLTLPGSTRSICTLPLQGVAKALSAPWPAGEPQQRSYGRWAVIRRQCPGLPWSGPRSVAR